MEAASGGPLRSFAHLVAINASGRGMCRQHALQQVIMAKPAMIEDAGEMCGNRQHQDAGGRRVQRAKAAVEQVGAPSNDRKGQQQHVIAEVVNAGEDGRA